MKGGLQPGEWTSIRGELIVTTDNYGQAAENTEPRLFTVCGGQGGQ